MKKLGGWSEKDTRGRGRGRGEEKTTKKQEAELPKDKSEEYEG